MPITTPAGPAGARIVSLGHYQPDYVVTNHDLIARGVETDDEWIKSRVGIAERRFAQHESLLDMAEAASSKAIANSGIPASDIDLVILATCTQLFAVPNGSAELAHRLGITSPGAYDLNAACAGFAYAVAAASSAIMTGQARNVLVVGAEKLSDWLDFTDRTTCIIFADGAGAAVITASDEIGIGPVVWGSDGANATAISTRPETHALIQDGQTVYRWATSTVGGVALEACERAGVRPDELAAFVPHQANLRIIDMVAKKLGATNAAIARDIVTSGNTSSASIPIAWSKMLERGEIPSGRPVLIVGFGAGLTYAGQVVLSP
ncbi:ketoacyl-ACP synthase III [Jatrophihabitans telluris]|uniref:Ketoacyl-ACP synthase III n=1 Tax=Jatrophihabitans telluris TaxID=2038343 RepID=A0ABY4QWW4_9ACTN|nr:beta-ketoacyl-ACP synthase III [Jatrophihabitans telluris]UQX87316.1 ketoacyl-ACP synthase III [Jatrophihabitans telluris]